ncbi:unnamed protein product [Protopolystoma xenopodis]|uniref:Uncharacterized protein n=1 Tax=Protopolystoma xenopodis TaxID=117903 RepID=A0A448XJ46_9PLAT|nr:unnamed protein product [Protopolystoma xenopodis]
MSKEETDEVSGTRFVLVHKLPSLGSSGGLLSADSSFLGSETTGPRFNFKPANRSPGSNGLSSNLLSGIYLSSNLPSPLVYRYFLFFSPSCYLHPGDCK